LQSEGFLSALSAEHKEQTRLIMNIANETTHEHAKEIQIGTLFETIHARKANQMEDRCTE
jgi:hypothetical protein